MTSPTESTIATLIEISRRYGSDPSFVLAGGGNTSAKIGDRLYVKASGHALATIDEEGFVEMDRNQLQSLADSDLGSDPEQREALFKQAIYAARISPERGQRPSVECLLHHLLPGRFVVHTHATIGNALTCHSDGATLAQELFGDDVIWIPYVDPGFTLAQTMISSLADYRKSSGRESPKAVLMANHGMILGADSAEQIRQQTDEVLDRIANRLGDNWRSEPFGATAKVESPRALINTIGPALRALLAENDDLKVVTFDDSETTLSLVAGEAGETAARGGPLCPDQIVYCNSYPLWFEPRKDEQPGSLVERLRAEIARHTEETRFPPKVVLVKGVGLFAAGETFQAADTVRNVYLDAIAVMSGARHLGGISFMTDAHRQFIEDWEVEAYRRQIAAGDGARGRVAGKVAVVTGAAQGFGLEIAQSLAAEGGHVVLTDLNENGAREAAGQLCARYGVGSAMGLPVNVTDGQSIADCLHGVVRSFGGFDIFISNAGVLKAESVKTQPLRDFEFVTSVNYTGYFLCTQKVAPILAVQHLAKPDYLSDIIQINSKSGLVGSNRNAAYAGGKFGGIGLTQSFALELVEDGIKVNSICPGNFFDGPLWSDPDRGLFVQYLRTGKVPGATTIEDVKKFYEAKVPFGRGCRTADVMNAVFYLVDQRYETGQAVPVTGGQVMLS